ncbi:MAG: sugar transferase [Acidimicrobiales bacterium]
MISGTVVVVAGLGRFHALRHGYDLTESARFTWSLAYGILLLVSAYAIGLPDLPRTLRAALGTAGVATLSAALGISIVQMVTGDELLPRFVVFGTVFLLVPVYTVAALLATRGRARAEDRDRVLLVSAPSSVEAGLLQAELERDTEKPALLVGTLLVDEAIPTAGRPTPLMDRVRALDASVLVLDRVAGADEQVVAQAAYLHEEGRRVRTLSLFYEEWLGKLPLGELERSSLFFDIGGLQRERYARAKRVVDVVFAFFGVPVLLVFVPVVAMGNLVANRGPLFYAQSRVGQAGTTFSILKFRTMRPDGGASSGRWTSEHDPRITSFGRLLRRSHLDELPQVLNILRGHISVVGPRPEQPHYVDELAARLPFYQLRHLVRPGLTGWAQVKYGYAGTERDAMQKLQYEFYYLRHQALWLDLRIIGRTLRIVLHGGGR